MWLELRDAVRRFGDRGALDGVSFGLEEGEIGCLLGPSGCGKTTALRCIAGFETLDAGKSSRAAGCSPVRDCTCRRTSAASGWSFRTMRCSPT